MLLPRTKELSPMDCREFQNKHVTFVDDLLPAVEMEAMERHLAHCSRCSRHNTAIRRSLMLVHNLPPIEPSPEFMSRLNARLEQMSPMSRTDLVAPRPYLSSVGAVAALAAGILAVAYMAVETTHYYAPAMEARVVPLSASASSHSELGGQWRLCRFRADGNSGVARGADGRRGADAFREMDFHEAERDALSERTPPSEEGERL